MTDFKRTIRRDELRQIVPLADSTVYEMEAKGEFPKRFNLTPRCVVWYLEEVEAWVAERRDGKIEMQKVVPPKRKPRAVKPALSA